MLVVLSLAFFYTATTRASAKPFWHDEIYTLVLTSLPSFATFWAAMRAGLDLAPPLNALLTDAVELLFGTGHVVSHLIPMISFWVMSMMLFGMVHRRANATVALTAALLPINTAAYRYSYEARPYALMMALFTVAVFAWAEAAGGRRRPLYLPLLCIALGAGLWNHYYAVLAYTPVVAGELIRTLRRRRMDWGVLSAVAVSGIAAFPLLPLMNAGAQQASSFWAQASLEDVGGAYHFLMEPLLTRAAFAASAVVVVLALLGRLVRPASDVLGKRSALPAHEIAAGVVSLLLPFIGVLLGMFVTGVFVPRYVLSGVVGLSLVIPLAIWSISARARIVEVVLPLVLLVGYAEMFTPVTRFIHPVNSRPALVASLQLPTPTVVTGGLTYLQLWYYAPTELKPRLTYIADPDYALRYSGSDTFDSGYLTLARWATVNIAKFDSFTANNQEFRVYAFGSGWLLNRLEDAHAQIEDLGSDPGARLLNVRLPHGKDGS